MTATATALAGRLLASLDPEQRAAATLPDGPALVIAPAGSGKTTTLIARLGVLLSRGVAPERIAVATFNRDAALELSGRIASRLAPDAPGASRIEVRTLHALARRILVEARGPQPLVADRLSLLRALLRRSPGPGAAGDAVEAPLPDPAELDTDISAWKVEGRPARDPSLVADYQALLAARRAVDFDDLVAGAADLLTTDPRLRARWQARFSHLCVDEFQDVDAGQLRLVRLLAAPEDNLFVVGDDDQTIYAWRLADVRRILGFADIYPAARRVQLATNYRCPSEVVAVSRRLIEHNRERYAKRILAGGPGSDADAPRAPTIAALSTGAPDWADRLVAFASGQVAGGRTCCFLARTRSELQPLVVAAVRLGVQHTTTVPAPVEAAPVRELVAALRALPSHLAPFDTLLRLRAGRGWRRPDGAVDLGDEDHAALDALLGWSVAFAHLDRFLTAHDAAVARLTDLRRPDAGLELVTVHAAKGREWETVVVIGMEEDRFPNRRALLGARDPERALEEERRLAYVALTRATRTLVLAYDPARPSRFLAEMGIGPRDRPRAPPR